MPAPMKILATLALIGALVVGTRTLRRRRATA